MTCDATQREEYASLCRSLAAWLLGESQGSHRELKRGETADRLLEIAALIVAQSSTRGIEKCLAAIWDVCEAQGTPELDHAIDRARDAYNDYRSAPSASGRSDLVQVSRSFLETTPCPNRCEDGMIVSRGPDPVFEPCQWCEAKSRFLAGYVPLASTGAK